MNRLTRSTRLRIGYVDAEATLRTSLELVRYPLGVSERLALRSSKADFCIPANDTHFEKRLTNLHVRRLVKVGIVTRDLDATVRHWINLAGIGPWHLFDMGPDRLRHVSVAGASAAFSVRVAWALIDDILLELVQPTGGCEPLSGAPRHSRTSRRLAGRGSVLRLR